MPMIDPIAVNGGRLDDPRYPANSRTYPANQNLNAMNSVGEFTDTGTGGRTNNDLRVDQNPNTRAGYVNPWGNGTTPTVPTTPASPNGAGGGNGGGYGYGTTTTGGTPYSGDYDLSDYLRMQAAARIEGELANLSGAYKQAMNGYDAELKNIQKSYYNQRNQSAAQDAIARRNFDERAAASGLNSGTAGQADLARSAAYTGELARLGAAEDAERNAVEMNRANAQAQYEQAMAQAKANNQQQLAGDLYKELIRVQGLEREDAINAAKAAASASSLRYYSPGKDAGDKTADSPTGKDYTALDSIFGLYGLDGAQDYIKANYKALGYDNQTQALSDFNYHLREAGKYPTPEEPAPAVAPQAGGVTNGAVRRAGADGIPQTYYLINGTMPASATTPYVGPSELEYYRRQGIITPIVSADGTITYTWA